MPDKSEVLRAFVQAASAIPEVQLILLTGSAEGERVWTVIDAPTFEESYRHKVYQAELDALDASGGAYVDFFLLNVRELRGGLEDVLPQQRHVLFQREQAA